MYTVVSFSVPHRNSIIRGTRSIPIGSDTTKQIVIDYLSTILRNYMNKEGLKIEIKNI